MNRKLTTLVLKLAGIAVTMITILNPGISLWALALQVIDLVLWVFKNF